MIQLTIIRTALFALFPVLAVRAQATQHFCQNASQTPGSEAFAAYYNSAGTWQTMWNTTTFKAIPNVPELVKCVDECQKHIPESSKPDGSKRASRSS